jgi:hypothetical protein
MRAAHVRYRDKDGGGDVDFDEFWTWFQNASKTGSGLAAEIQRGLKRSEMLRNARDAMFAAFDSGPAAQRHLRQLFDRLDEDGLSLSLSLSLSLFLSLSLCLSLSLSDGLSLSL